MQLWRTILSGVESAGAAALVTLVEACGSTPRDVPARMAVLADGAFSGSIGGGALEWQALAEAVGLMRQRLAAGKTLQQVLGPDLGQCCGGRVRLLIESFVLTDVPILKALARAEEGGAFRARGRRDHLGRIVRKPVTGDVGLGERYDELSDGTVEEQFGEGRTPVMLLGGGHVGRALVLALAPLPFLTDWLDQRADAFPSHVPANVRRLGGDPLARIRQAAPGTLLLVMSHCHALDFDAVAAGLSCPAIIRVGLIGSASKRARFRSRLSSLGLEPAARDRLVCPIGSGRVRSKAPAAIAASVAVQLLEWRDEATDIIDTFHGSESHVEPV